MIIQHRQDDIAVIAQADHARLAGDMAAHWGGAASRFGRWDELVRATSRHDDGWIAWDASPKFGDSGAPYDFISAPMFYRAEIYRLGVRAVLEEHPWTILLVSMHLTGLFLGRYEPNATPMIDNLTVADREIAQKFIAEETARQDRLKSELGTDPTSHYRLLQVFDRLSLTLCLQAIENLGKNTIDYVPFSEGEEGVLSLWSQDGVIRMEPYPFDQDRVTMAMPVRSLRKDSLSNPQDYLRGLGSAPVENLTFTFAPA